MNMSSSLIDEVIDTIISTALSSSNDQTLEFSSTSPEKARSILSHLDNATERSSWRLGYDSVLEKLRVVLNPNSIHDVHQPWVENWLDDMVAQGLLTFAEKKGLERYVGTTFTQFGGNYASSRKEPDLCIKPVGMALPTIVIESGWSESREQLYNDRDLWLKGGHGSVQVVIIVKWTQNAAKQVAGDVELFDLDADKNARMVEKRSIFPPPGLSEAVDSRGLTITKGQLWGPQLAGTSDASGLLRLSIDELRMITARNMQAHGYSPII